MRGKLKKPRVGFRRALQDLAFAGALAGLIATVAPAPSQAAPSPLPSGVPDFLDLTHLTFEGRVNPPGQPACRPVGQPEGSVLCQADPFNEICDTVPVSVVSEMQQIRDQAKSFTGPGGEDRAKAQAPAVRATIRQAVGAFQEMLGLRSDGTWANHRILSVAERAYLKRTLDACAANVSMDGSWQGSNAAVHQNYSVGSLSHRYHNHPDRDSGHDIRLQALPNNSCELKLTTEKWAECAAGAPSCYRTLFHELGHLLNTCNMTVSAWIADHEQGEVSETHPLAEPMARSRERIRSLESGLRLSTECLSSLSSPRSGIPNACPEAAEVPAPLISRCGISAVETHAPEWNEAEADFWAASATAAWLRRTPSVADRQARTLRMVQYLCQVTLFSRDHSSPQLTGADADKCQNRSGATGRVPPGRGWDSHQNPDVRINRNYLRNLDLRETLGCRLGGWTGVPGACSPSGLSRWVIPQ